ncbi:MLP-like protein 328 [Mangifera indica]|uniref:MLP-like protein 328 n=1 Tax=Mangifera indica TaxID=29780 RepID=UPI001CFB72FF|nr:MLP-like protein 328 [Mangifera indica]
MAGLSGKVEREVEIEAPAEKFYKVWKFECFHLPTASLSNIQGVLIREGDWETNGSIRIWNDTVEGKSGIFKEKVEADDEHMTLTLNGIERDIYNDFRFWELVFKVAPK